MQLIQKQKTFSGTFFAFWKSKINLKIAIKNEPHS